MKRWEKLYAYGIGLVVGLVVGSRFFFNPHDRVYIKNRNAYGENGQCIWFIVNDDHFSDGVFEAKDFAETRQAEISHPTTLVRVPLGYGDVVPNSRFMPRQFPEKERR